MTMMKYSGFLLCPLALVLYALLPSCSQGVKTETTPAHLVPVEEMTGYFEKTGWIPGHLLGWYDEPSLPGRLMIVIDKKKQMMLVYRGTHRIAHAPVSSGKSPGMTPAGLFKISSKDKDHHSYYGTFVSRDGSQRDGDIRKHSARSGEQFEPASMPYFMRVNGAVGIHEGYMPGYPASHGCIRIPHPTAVELFETAKIGTLVAVVDGKWDIHSLQKKSESLFRTVHRPVPVQVREQTAKTPAPDVKSGDMQAESPSGPALAPEEEKPVEKSPARELAPSSPDESGVA